jgi:tRNA pseudouridine38-40 synthase
MARYQITLAYDGTNFSGFQRQARNKKSRTVQGSVEDALRHMGWQGGSILAAGRTDAGVHASGQVIAFDLDWGHGEDDLRAALNAHLPFDVAAQSVFQARPDFHPRYDALSRRYRYQIFCRPTRDPLRERYAWRVWPAIDLERLQSEAVHLPGVHDFSAFGTPPRSGGTTIRQVLEACWKAQKDDIGGNQITFEIAANAFLFRMVRRLVGFQVRIGQGKLDGDSVRQRLNPGSKELVRNLAPAYGLNLIEVVYPEPGYFEDRLHRKADEAENDAGEVFAGKRR